MMQAILGLALAMLVGCTTQHIDNGPARPQAESAVVRADPAFSAGLPVSLRLRKADNQKTAFLASSIELPAGHHSLLVDCRVLESGVTRRFVVEADLEAGREYRLVARAPARNCDAVELIGQ
jgi:hypothetical protein